MKKVFKFTLLIFLLITLSGCQGGKIKEIKYSELENKLKNNETFVLEIVQDGCHNCESFTPKLKKFAKKYNIDIFQINNTNLTEEDTNNINNLYNITGTPTVIFITDGKEESITNRIIGNVSEEKIISKFKKMNYIK